MKNKQNLIIIGAGLSGLYAATLLQDKFNVTVLEARDRLGGRILTTHGHDLGPSWIWPHQKHILSLIKELELELFTQYTKGDDLYDAPQGVQKFQAPASATSSRVVGGLQSLIDKLATRLPESIIQKNEEVLSIKEDGITLNIETNTKHYKASYVLSTLSPRLACEHIKYVPDLDISTKKQMLDIPTWMGHTAKCVIEFESAFWKEQGLSGFIYSPLGPLGEIHDASTHDKAALFGFLQGNANTENIKEDVTRQMKRLFPNETIKNIYLVDWRDEKFSSHIHDKKGLSAHPEYGHTLSHFSKKLYFIGTESSYNNGGYLEGALISAKEIAIKLLSCN